MGNSASVDGDCISYGPGLWEKILCLRETKTRKSCPFSCDMGNNGGGARGWMLSGNEQA